MTSTRVYTWVGPIEPNDEDATGFCAYEDGTCEGALYQMVEDGVLWGETACTKHREAAIEAEEKAWSTWPRP